MMTTKPRLLHLALAGLLSLPIAAAAQAQTGAEHSAHHPESGQAAAATACTAAWDAA